MKITTKKHLPVLILVGITLTKFVSAQTQVDLRESSINDLITRVEGWFYLIFFFLGAFSSIILYSWYIKRGGKSRWLILAALVPLVVLMILAILGYLLPSSLCCGDEGDLYTGIFLFYVIIIPLVSSLLYFRRDGKRRWPLRTVVISSILLLLIRYGVLICNCPLLKR